MSELKITDTKTELLTILAEECAEVIVECSKIQRFGNETTTLEAELGDVLCMMELLQKYDLINWHNVEQCAQAKEMKLRRWSNIFKGEKNE